MARRAARPKASRRVRQYLSLAPARNLKTPPKGYLCMNPRVLPPFFRPQATPCEPGSVTYRDSPVGSPPSFNPNPLLDIANDGTFSGARRAATLGHQNPDDVMRAIGALGRAAQDGRLTEGYAAGRIAELADTPVAAAQADQRVRALTLDELDARRRRASGGLSDTTLDAARAAKLEEVCDPPYCFIEKDGRGIEVAMNYGKGRTRDEIMRDPAFSRFCNEQELARIAGKLEPEGWGEWWITKARQAFAGNQSSFRDPLDAGATLGQAAKARPVPGKPGELPPPPDPNGKKYLCLDPRVLPPFFRVYDGPCTAPLIPYPGQ